MLEIILGTSHGYMLILLFIKRTLKGVISIVHALEDIRVVAIVVVVGSCCIFIIVVVLAVVHVLFTVCNVIRLLVGNCLFFSFRPPRMPSFLLTFCIRSSFLIVLHRNVILTHLVVLKREFVDFVFQNVFDFFV